MNRKALLLIVLLCCSLAAPLAAVSAQTDDTRAQTIHTIRLPNMALHTPVSVAISFTFTQSYVINVTSLMQSLHQEISSPTGITFQTNDVDVFNIHIQIRYDVWVNQTITISISEESQPGEMIEFDMYSKGFNIDLTLSTSPAAHIPTVDEISNALWDRWQNEILQLEGHERTMVDTMSSTVVFAGALAAISFAVVIAALVIFIRQNKRVATLEALMKRGGKS